MTITATGLFRTSKHVLHLRDPVVLRGELQPSPDADPMLHLANSAYYSPRTPIGPVERAITLLGFGVLLFLIAPLIQRLMHGVK